VNADVVIDIQESGIAVASTTLLDGQLAIRAAIVNHRTDTRDIDALLSAVLEFGRQRCSSCDRVPLIEPSPPLAM
jgi:aromatic-L-amino-acid decarboxylase